MIKRKPYLLFFITAIAFLFGAFISNEKSVINIGDTYYVITDSHIYAFLSFIFFCFFILYWSFIKMKFQFNIVLSKTHVFGTLLLLTLFLYFNYKNSIDEQPANIEEILNQTDYDSYLLNIMLAFVLLQVLLFMNIFVAVIKKMRISHSSQRQ